MFQNIGYIESIFTESMINDLSRIIQITLENGSVSNRQRSPEGVKGVTCVAKIGHNYRKELEGEIGGQREECVGVW